jgi:NAD(P)-dependent dehydrogenase (short-subunit alcohol dehydrogenase family)
MHSSWSVSDIAHDPDRVVVVTGATSGLGLETAKAVAKTGATVVLTARSMAKGEAAAAQVQGGRAEVMVLDLTSLDSIRTFAAQLAERHPKVDVLVNNAGVMATPLQRTSDGFELQIGTNHLGHHALTAVVLPLLEESKAGRIVTVSSVGHRQGHVALDDLNWERRPYRRWPAYFQSKLANLMFAFELDRRLRSADSSVTSLAAHPGGSRSHLGIGAPGIASTLQSAVFVVLKPLMMPTAKGALSQIRAALDLSLAGGTYVGPNGPGEFQGHPVVVRAKSTAYDEASALALWVLSNKLTGASWSFDSHD